MPIHTITLVYPTGESLREENQQCFGIPMNSLCLVRIKGDKISCLGSQLGCILEYMKGLVSNCIWYGADVEVNQSQVLLRELSTTYARRIGSIQDLTKLALCADQFISGVFVAFEDDHGPELLSELFTEDEPFRVIPEAVVEIRAFDTTYFEVYTANREIVNVVAALFSTEVIEQASFGGALENL